MADDEILRWIDGHMARGNDHTARGNQLMSEVREEMRLSREQYADLRELIREHTLRAERVADRQVSALDALVVRQDEFVATMRGMRTEMADLRDESRAQTQVPLRVIDRLDDQGS